MGGPEIGGSFLDEVKAERAERMSYLDIPDEAAQEKRTEEREEDIIAFLEEVAQTKPGFLEVNELVGTYERTNNKTERAAACKEVAAQFFSRPEMLSAYFQETERQHFFNEEKEDQKADSILNLVQRGVDREVMEGIQRGEFRFSTKNSSVLGKWIEMMGSPTGARAEVFNYWKESWKSGDDIHAFSDYKAAMAQELLREKDYTKVLSLINFDIGNLSVLNEMERLRLSDKSLASMTNVRDDVALQKVFDANAVFAVIQQRFGLKKSVDKIQQENNEALMEACKNGKYKDSLYIKGLSETDASRTLKTKLDNVWKYYDYVDDNDVEVVPDFTSYPFNLVFDTAKISPMRRELNKYSAENGGPNSRVIFKPGLGEYPIKISPNAQERPAEVQEFYLKDAKGEYDEGRMFETLAAQFPNITPEGRAELSASVEQAKRDLKFDARYLVSPRGDVLAVTDPELRDKYGITRIAFMPTTSVVDLQVRIHYRDQFTAVCRLDSDFALREMKKAQPIDLSTDAHIIWQDILFSHLKEVMCNRPVSSGSEGVSVQSEQDQEGKSVRRPHMRRLGAGKGFTLEQSYHAMKEYGVDLFGYNNQRRLAKVDGQFTFVSEGGMSFEEAKKLPPVVSHVGPVGKWHEIFSEKEK